MGALSDEPLFDPLTCVERTPSCSEPVTRCGSSLWSGRSPPPDDTVGLLVIRPGLLTTVQDLGRWGHQHRGVPVSGAMDTTSHRLANRLVGNPESAATLELTMTGVELVFEAPTVFAVAGAEFELSLDDVPVCDESHVRGRCQTDAPVRVTACRCPGVSGIRGWCRCAGGSGAVGRPTS